MNFDVSASLATSVVTGVFPGAPGAGQGHPFELRAGPWFGGELQVISLRGRERMNDVYRYEVTFATDQPPELVTSAIFGLPACLTIKSPGNDPRVIQGIAVSIEALGGVGGEQGSKRRRFSLTIVPRLWLLRHRRQNRIFQNKSIPEIVSKVLAAVGIQDSDCRWRADKTSYPALPFVYQRGETDWEFFRRILASAGIFFFYEHASGFLDSMFGGAASAVAGAVGAAAGMLGGAIASAVSTVESVTGMVPVLNFGDQAGHTAAVASGLGGVAADAAQAALGALGGALGGAAGAAVSAVAGAVEEPSDTLTFDDDMGSNAHVERVFEFELKKTLRTKELRILDRDVEAAKSWVGVASVADASASINLSAGLSLAGGLSSGGLSGVMSAAANVGATFDVDAPTIPASELRQEIYQEDLTVWQDTRAPGLGPPISLSASQSIAGIGISATAQAAAMGAFNKDAAMAKRLGIELERVRRRYQEGAGSSDCRRMGAGYRFTLGGHPINMVNGEYTVTALDVVGVHPDFLGDGQAVYRNRFRCIPSQVAARPKRPRRRPKPGMEVARVVGFIGGESLPGLEANPAGYVRVRFRWEILDDDATPNGSLEIGGDKDDVYSVWLPVVQPWAGNGYGMQFIPREGMEVLVGFLEHQSERPVILGCLYSEENRPPWSEYVAHQRVGIRSQSRPETGGYSELSIDDRRGDEVVRIRAQHNLDVDVLNNSRVLVHANTHLRTQGSAAVEVEGDSISTVKGGQRLSVDGSQTSDVKGSQTATIGESAVRDVRTDDTLRVGGSRNVTVGGALRLQVQRDVVETAGGDRVSTTGRRQIVTVGTVGSEAAESDTYVWGSSRLGARDTITIESEKEIVFRCGKSEIHLKPDTIEIKGQNVSAAGSKQLALGGNGPSLSLGDELQVMSKTMSVQSSGAMISLGDSAVIQSKSVQLGKPAQLQSSIDPSGPVTKPALSLTMLAADGTPLANCNYQVQIGSTTAEGTTDGSGGITVASIPDDVTTGRCTVWTGAFPEGPRLVFDLAIGALEPATTVLGAQKRLRNLGFLQADPTEAIDSACFDAILVFQEAYGLELTGELDAATIAKLGEIHP